MGKFIDMAGWKMWEHGVPESKISVIEQYPIRSNDGHVQWECLCNVCNTKFITTGKVIRNGHTKTCGCQTNRKKDMIGKTFNYLTVLYELPSRGENNKRIYYHCKCKCGNECDIDGISLRNGKTKSCGCYKSEQTSKVKTKDLTGQIFGLLTVKERYNKPSKDGRV